MDLNTIWFLLFGVLLVGYAILDGFDLGVGVLTLLGKTDEERRVHLNSIGPVWDGNEVWLLTAGGALFAAFPPVYATVFSGLYLAFMLLLLALIGRAVAMEFRSKVEDPRWRRVWDVVFAVGSLVPSLLYGVAVGNILRGLPLDAQGNHTGTFLGLLNPYALLVGGVSLAMFLAHGALYLAIKSEGELHERMKRLAPRLWMAWVGLYIAASVVTFVSLPQYFKGLLGRPLFWLAFLSVFGAMLYIPVAINAGKLRRAFLGSSLAIAAMTGLVGLSLYPTLVPARNDPALSLTIYNSSSSPLTLKVMLVIALIGMPIVIAYTVFIYRVFKGKVVIGKESY